MKHFYIHYARGDDYTFEAGLMKRRAGGMVDFYRDGQLVRRFFDVGRYGVTQWYSYERAPWAGCPPGCLDAKGDE